MKGTMTMLTKEILKTLALPTHVEWTEDNGTAYVYDTRDDAKTFRAALEELLGTDHPATLVVRCAFYGDGDSGWTVALDYHGPQHRTVFPAQGLTIEQAKHEPLTEDDLDAICAEYDDECIERRRHLYKRLDALCEHIEDLEREVYKVRMTLEDVEKGIVATANEELWTV